jgi:DNA-binding transcriptional MerR regulator
MRIGELSKRTDTPARSLRYYEEQELIVPSRLPNGYRDYDEYLIDRVNQIRGLRALQKQAKASHDPPQTSRRISTRSPMNSLPASRRPKRGTHHDRTHPAADRSPAPPESGKRFRSEPCEGQ